MAKDGVVPEGENLRNAVRWLSENAPLSRESIDAVSRRFDLTPLEEEFLLQEFLPGSG